MSSEPKEVQFKVNVMGNSLANLQGLYSVFYIASLVPPNRVHRTVFSFLIVSCYIFGSVATHYFLMLSIPSIWKYI